MPIIRFSHNWNKKLDGNIFTTIRKYDEKKFEYYNSLLGHVFVVKLNNVWYSEAKLLACYIEKFSDVSTILLRLDTGISDITNITNLFEKFRIGLQDKVIILLFERIMK